MTIQNLESPSKNGSEPDSREKPQPSCQCCSAHTQVRLPWLDINARLQVAANHHDQKDQKEKKSAKEGKPIFSLPGLSLRTKKERGQKNGKKAAGKYAGDSNGDAWDDAIAAYDGVESKTAGDVGANEHGDQTEDGKEMSADDWQDLSVPKKKKTWHGCLGLAIMSFGVVMPTLLMLITVLSLPKRLTLIVLNHPMESLAELLLSISIPIANYVVWSAICKNNLKFSLARGISLGAAAGSALVLAGVCLAAIFAGQQDLSPEMGLGINTGLSWLAMLMMASAAVSVFLANKVRLSRDFASSRMQVLLFTIFGALLSVVTYISAEAKPFTVRLAERDATSNNIKVRLDGLERLRALNPERELLMECSDPRAAGLAALFIPLKTSAQHELYFSVTGKPFSFKDISNNDFTQMPDEYLSLHMVGAKVPGLSMLRSYMTGILHSDSLSSTIDWTFVFKNESGDDQAARAEIGLPPGAVVTGLKLWTKGEPEKAIFSAIGSKHAASEAASQDSPAWIVDLGHDRVLLNCSSVTPTQELECALTVVMPMNPDGTQKATVAMPRFIATNFDMSGDHQVRLRSETKITASGNTLQAGVSQGSQKTLTGQLTNEQLETAPLLVTADRAPGSKSFVILDQMAVNLRQQEEYRRARELARKNSSATKHAPMMPNQLVVMIDGSKGVQKQLEDMTAALRPKSRQAKAIKIKVVKSLYVVQKLEHISAPAPTHLVIVVDGSQTMKAYSEQLSKALTTIPANVRTSIVVASDAPKVEAVKFDHNQDPLKDIKFIGGQDNLRAVVKGAELAGETKGGAVLWVHGPQPIFNEEIYIMPPYVAAPQFYDLSLGSGETDTYDFFKNHSEIGPFSQVPRNSSDAGKDLSAFVSKWRPNSDGYSVKLSLTDVKPKDGIAPKSIEQARELLALRADDEIKDFISKRHIRRATNDALAYGIVTPVSSAVVHHEETLRNVEEQPSSHQMAQLPEDSLPGQDAGNALQQQNEAFNDSQTAQAPSLQGTTNGTIGPQGDDATYVTGVNTAGTVRVNNLANLEAMLNIIANLGEAGLGLIGALILLNAAISKTVVLDFLGQELELSRSARLACGLLMIFVGLAIPGVINWFVASARDANLFS